MISLWAYPQLTGTIATHWNADGQANGTMSKFWGLLLLPLVSLGMLALFLVLPLIDPLKKNFEKFRREYNFIIITLMCFISYINLLIVMWNIGLGFNMSQAIAPGIGALFFLLGLLIKNIKMNWFVGIRTPWTLSSDTVWQKTHVLGSKLFMISGVIAATGAIFPNYSVLLMVVPVIVSSLWAIFYSYFEYQKENHKNPPRSHSTPH